MMNENNYDKSDEQFWFFLRSVVVVVVAVEKQARGSFASRSSSFIERSISSGQKVELFLSPKRGINLLEKRKLPGARTISREHTRTRAQASFQRREGQTFVLKPKRSLSMSAYGFGATTTSGNNENSSSKNQVIGRWQHHHLATRDALASCQKASEAFEECCCSTSSRSGSGGAASVEEKIRSKNIFARELERFKDALEKLENCLTMG